ncbi:hypothetical protein JVU11DRAFT_12541 [Chiua virens]|nr:hypothetical protein JVU11DRAFT_12541 [Chiua virens]
MHDLKKHLTITLTEPVVFLRSSDPSGRLPPGSNDPSALVRGILTLNVVKPVVISSIEVELTGLLTIYHSEVIGITSRHPEPLEKHKVYSSISAVFRADHGPHGRRPASVGPGSSAPKYDNELEHVAIVSSCRPSPPRRNYERRSAVSVPPDLGPTPPYTRMAQSSSTDHTILCAPVEDPTQTSEQLRRALSDTLEGQAHRIHPPSTPSSPPHTTPSNVSSESFYRRNDSNHDVAFSSRYVEGDTSRHNTAEDLVILSHRGHSTGRPPRAHSPGDTNRTRPPIGRNSRDSSEAPAGHSHLRFSLGSVLDAFAHKPRGVQVYGSEERERGRPRDRNPPGEQSRTGTLEVDDGIANTLNGRQLMSNASHPSGHMERREHHLLGLGRLLGLERVHEKYGEQKHTGGWGEFTPGTYSYPISFLLPPNLPPSFTVPHGSLTYAIKGVAHRPGTFASKFSCHVPLSVVAAPALGAGESSSPGESGPLLIQKQWEGKLAYTFGLSSRLFILSPQRNSETMTDETMSTNAESLPVEAEVRPEAEYGTATLDLTLQPLEKIKIWKFGVFVDQRISYADEEGRILRDDDKKRTSLLEVQDICPAEDIRLLDDEELMHKNKHKTKHDQAIPLVPTPISPHRSPLLQYLPPSADPSILTGPGPYTLTANLRLPGEDSGLHFTVKHKSSSVRVVHSLRVVLRVERVSDEQPHDHEDGENKKMFDIAVQTPITILSYDSIPEYQIPPRYCEFMEDSLQTWQSSIEGSMENDRDGMAPSSASSLASTDGAGQSYHLVDELRRGYDDARSPSRACGSGHPHPLLPVTHLHSHPLSPSGLHEVGSSSHSPRHSRHQHHHSHSASYTVSTFHVHAHPHSTPVSTPLSSRPPSPVIRYERLVSGLESEAGVAPPSYESISSVSE